QSFDDPDLPDWAKDSRKQQREEMNSILANVFTGSVMSDWVTSEPPHNWLFTEAPHWAITAEQLPRQNPKEFLSRVFSFIGSMASWIELNAKVISTESVSSLDALEGRRKTSVGQHLNLIQEYALEIQKAVKEAPTYLESKVPPQIDQNSLPHEPKTG